MAGAPARLLVASAVTALLASGCPMTDEYFVAPEGMGGGSASASGVSGASGASGASSEAGASAGGALAGTGGKGGKGGTGGTGGTRSGAGEGGSDSGGTAQGGLPGSGGAPAPCEPSPEQCNGRDDNCNDEIDETGCQLGCFGFVEEEQGYMFCDGFAKRHWIDAKSACIFQSMRLVRIEDAVENAALRAKVAEYNVTTNVYISATDYVKEGDWYWDGGPLFWKGVASGNAEPGAYENWDPFQPDGDGDCGVLVGTTGMWLDTDCGTPRAFVCEEL